MMSRTLLTFFRRLPREGARVWAGLRRHQAIGFLPSRLRTVFALGQEGSIQATAAPRLRPAHQHLLPRMGSSIPSSAQTSFPSLVRGVRCFSRVCD